MLPFTKYSLVALLLLWFAFPVAAQEVVVPVDHFPPWKFTDDNGLHGIDIDLINALLAEAGISPRFTSCPWKRCLQMMRDGTADIISGVLRTPERERYMLFIEPPYKIRSNKVLYLRNDSPDVTSLTDLHMLTVGQQRGAKFFRAYDQDTFITRSYYTHDQQGFAMLKRGRIDALITTESQGDFILAQEGLRPFFKKATYRFDAIVPVYFAVSLRSPLASRIADLNQAVKTLEESGVIYGIIKSKLPSFTQ